MWLAVKKTADSTTEYHERLGYARPFEPWIFVDKSAKSVYNCKNDSEDLSFY